MGNRAIVATGGVLVGLALTWALYSVLWVADVAFSPGGDTHWSNPMLAAALLLLAGGASCVSVVLGVRLLRSEAREKTLRAWFAALVVVTLAATLPLPFLALVAVP